MAITRINGQENGALFPSDPWEFTINVGTRTNGLLIVRLGYDASNLAGSHTASYGGSGMSANPSGIAQVSKGTGYLGALIYYIINPQGSNTFSWNQEIQFGGIVNVAWAYSTWYDGVAQTSPLDDDTIATGTSGTPTLDLSPSEANELLVNIYTSEANDVLTKGTNGTFEDDYDHGLRVNGASYEIQTAQQSPRTFDWSGSSDYWVQCGATFKAAAVASNIVMGNFKKRPYYEPSIRRIAQHNY